MDRYLEYIGLFSIMMFSTALAGCPSKCICSKNTVRCTEKSLINIPNFETLDNDPVVIDLSANEIDYIAHYDLSFDKAEIVQILYLNDSVLIDIDDTAFKELINLRELYMSQNLLSDLPPKSFVFNDNLVYLDLSFNLFRIMPKIISSSLKTLNLMNSGIEHIDSDRFIHLPSLRYLYLQRNNIRIIDLDMFKYLPQLVRIELEFNAWKCNCESVEIFNFLSDKGLIKIKEPIQCRTENDIFITIFDETGSLKTVEDMCIQNRPNLSYSFGGELLEEIPVNLDRQPKPRKTGELHNRRDNLPTRKSQQSSKITNTCEYIEYTSFTLSTYLIITAFSLSTFIIGLILGSVILGEKKNVTNNSSSFNSLLKRDSII